jgi:hypothetical protein
MSWLERLKRTEAPAESVAANVARKPDIAPVSAPAPNADVWAWPHSSAMNSAEIRTFSERSSQFNRRGMPAVHAELLAYKLVNRDREEDDRRLCVECGNMAGREGAWRCNQWQRAGMGAAGIPAGLVLVLQRCDGFRTMR